MSVLENYLNLIFNDTLSDEKKILKVVIFGPYKEGGFKRLREVRDFLRESGYKDTNLVEELNYPRSSAGLSDDVFAYRKSFYWLEESQVRLFIFFQDIPHDSVTSELIAFLKDLKDKIRCASFFKEQYMDLGPIVKGGIKDNGGFWNDFDNKDDLLRMCEKSCLHHLIEEGCHND